jgi:predicted metalloprotease with PDZ domain
MRHAISMLVAAAAIVAAAARAATAEVPSAPMVLVVDAREAPRNILHVNLSIPVSPGPFTLVYPKWIPGEHGPTGPIQNMAALRIAANGAPIPWQRDLVDMYAFHVTVPAGAANLDISFDQLMTSQDPMSTPNIVIINWNRVLLYPAGKKSDDVAVKPAIILPDGWGFGTALAGPTRSGNRVDFDTVDLTTLVDSPLDAGRYFKRIPLVNADPYTNEIDVVADAAEDLALSDDNVRNYKNLIAETDALYGARHWYHYHFLLTLSDVIPFQGIEHHQSSDNRAGADYWTNADALENAPDLLPHEYSHSWNGKYRRPADLLAADYQVPEKTDLLWVYEGLNQYLGDMLAFRSGFVEPKMYPEYLAHIYAQMDYEPGRLADPLADTASAAPYLYQAPGEWASQRRSATDFYTEGELVWLSVDAIIRTQSHGEKSLDDFLKAFGGQHNTGPMVVPYTREDVVAGLNAVAPYDWNAFFQKWVYEVAPHPPAYGIDLTGWRLVWNAKPNRWDDLSSSVEHQATFVYSLGFQTDEQGKINDVLQGSPAAKAGIGTGTQIIAVNGRKYSAELLHDAVAAAKKSSSPISLIVVSSNLYRTVSIGYHGGDRYPHLQRAAGVPDLLGKIMTAHRPH